MAAPTTTASRRRLALILSLLAALLVLAPLAYLWQSSRVPGTYSVMDMGYPDYGGGPELTLQDGHAAGHGHDLSGTPPRSVRDLVADPARRADVRVQLVARQQDVEVGGRTVHAYTLNGRTPGPTITAVQGQLVEVSLTNASVVTGITLHWHGVDVPNAMDGVAGVTQDAVPVGGTFVYRFVADQAGTYWYHSHQVSDAQVAGGLFGALVVRPKPVASAGASTDTDKDVVALAHTYAGTRTLDGRPGDRRVAAKPGERVRVRVVNTDNGPVEVWSDHPYRVLAVDGSAVHGPALVRDRSVVLTSGGRVDLEVAAPASGSATRVQVTKGTAVVVGAATSSSAVPPQPEQRLDLLSYGTPAPVAFDVSHPQRTFSYDIGRRYGFVRGRPGLWWTVNGHLYPHVPMYLVREGEVVVMHIRNDSGSVHPMHLHGHHAVVLARNGVASTGSPWWVDSLNVLDGETYDVAFRADNPGIWMDHCHNLQHAAAGMVAHLMYEGIDTPYRIGGPVHNRPE
jgi:FtsP/CotA-like multicopper oxidase with cupredoxin domain